MLRIDRHSATHIPMNERGQRESVVLGGQAAALVNRKAQAVASATLMEAEWLKVVLEWFDVVLILAVSDPGLAVSDLGLSCAAQDLRFIQGKILLWYVVLPCDCAEDVNQRHRFRQFVCHVCFLWWRSNRQASFDLSELSADHAHEQKAPPRHLATSTYFHNFLDTHENKNFKKESKSSSVTSFHPSKIARVNSFGQQKVAVTVCVHLH